MVLFIDTHLNNIAIILYKDGSIIKQRIIEGERESGNIIMPTIKKILNKEIPDSIIVVNGPGSFTGSRLGVTIAKTLAYTWHKEIRTITSLECLAVSTDEENKIVAFSDKNGYYVGVFDHDNNLYGDYEYLSNSEFNEYQEKYNVLTDIELDYKKIIEFALSKKDLNPHEVNPLYVKKIAVEK